MNVKKNSEAESRNCRFCIFQETKTAMERPKKTSEEMICKGRLEVEKAEFEGEKGSFERYRVLRQDASVVLLHDKDRRKVILTRQFRYPVSAHSEEDILEIVAGKIDEGETPKEAALRETGEEAGYRVEEKNMVFLTTAYVSPGYTTERFHYFYAEVSESDRTGEGGGLESEHETIEIVEMDAEEFLSKAKSGGLSDSKTIFAALWCEGLLKYPHVEIKGYQ
jgi:nudix-type nucleoside diphosphatase (YffH/AdpP family)